MKPTKEEAGKFLKWLQDPENRKQSVQVMDEISQAIVEILRKKHILD